MEVVIGGACDKSYYWRNLQQQHAAVAGRAGCGAQSAVDEHVTRQRSVSLTTRHWWSSHRRAHARTLSADHNSAMVQLHLWAWP